jgi:hypothetical protein
VTEGRHCGVDRWVVFPMVTNLTFDVPAMRARNFTGGGCESVPYVFENERMLREIYELYPDLGRSPCPSSSSTRCASRPPSSESCANSTRFPFTG